MFSKSGVVIVLVMLVIAVVGYIQIDRIDKRSKARQDFINNLDSTPDQTSLQDALNRYAANQSLFSFSFTKAETLPERCIIVDKIIREEEDEGDITDVKKVREYKVQVGCP